MENYASDLKIHTHTKIKTLQLSTDENNSCPGEISITWPTKDKISVEIKLLSNSSMKF